MPELALQRCLCSSAAADNKKICNFHWETWQHQAETRLRMRLVQVVQQGDGVHDGLVLPSLHRTSYSSSPSSTSVILATVNTHTRGVVSCLFGSSCIRARLNAWPSPSRALSRSPSLRSSVCSDPTCKKEVGRRRFRLSILHQAVEMQAAASQQFLTHPNQDVGIANAKQRNSVSPSPTGREQSGTARPKPVPRPKSHLQSLQKEPLAAFPSSGS